MAYTSEEYIIIPGWHLPVTNGEVNEASQLVFASCEARVKTLWAGVRSDEDIL